MRRGASTLRYFVAVAEERHFGRAAAKLHIAQPPLSRQIRRFEAEIGETLLYRTTRSVDLSPAGEVLLERGREILAAAIPRSRMPAGRRAASTAGSPSGSPARRPMRSCPRSPPRCGRNCPGVMLDLRGELLTPAQVTRLLDGSLDLGLLRPPVHERDLETEVLRSEPLVAVLPGSHPLAGADAVPLEGLKDEPFVTYPSHFRSVVHDAVEDACAAHGFKPVAAHEVAETADAGQLRGGRARRLARPRFGGEHDDRGRDLPPARARPDAGRLAVAWRGEDERPVLARALDVIRRGLGGFRAVHGRSGQHGPIRARIDELMAQMTPAEKAGQLTQYFYFGLPAEPTPSPALGCDLDEPADDGRGGARARRGGLAAVRHRSGRDQPAAAARGRGQPARHPGAVRLRRHPRAAHDPPGADRDGRVLGSRRRSSAVRRSPPARRAPSASTGRSRRWSTSPAIRAGAGSSRARARTRTSAPRSPPPRSAASRAAELGAPERVIAGPKHFAGYGAALGGRDYDEVNLSDSELWNVYFPPFKAAIEAGAGNVMTAYMDLNGIPATGNRWLFTEVLRDTLGLRRLRRQRRQRRAQPGHPRLRRRPDRRRRPAP